MCTIASRLDEIASNAPDSLLAEDSVSRISFSQAVRISSTVAAWIQKQSFFDASQPIFTFFEARAAYLPIILGVMQSGMPWVGLDPTFPTGHNQRILRLTSEPKVITPKEYQGAANALDAGQQVFLSEEISDHNDRSLRFLPDPESTSLIIFTSGSTQEPKGVMRSHRCVVENAIAQSKAYELSPGDYLVGGYTPTVMGFLSAFLSIISAGGCYRPVQLKTNGDDGLFPVLRSQNANALRIVAPVYRTLFSSLSDESRFENIHKVILAADAVTPRDLDLFRKYFGRDSEIFHGLASSEAGAISVWRGTHEYHPKGQKLPCGKLLPSTSILVDIDGQIGRPVENRVGELLVSSPRIAQQYWQNEGLTNKKWITCEDGKRYCRTGDMVSFDEMGTLHHFGRADSVAKINGFLVDPFNVELVLSQYPPIKEAAVEIITESSDGRLFVEAFLVFDGEIDRVDFISYISENIPDSARPTLFYRMDELPRTHNGKLQRSSLQRTQPFTVSPTSSNTRQIKRGDLDRLRSIWSDILEINQINDDDNFFALGGDSLRIIALALQIEQKFSIRLSVENLSRLPSLSAMAKTIKSGRAGTNINLRPIELLSKTVSTWRGEQVEESGLLRTIGESGPDRLYWCLQNEHEFISLSNALRPRVQLYALRSLNLLVKRSPENLNSVAEAYAGAIIRAHSDLASPVTLGGNCQGSTLMLKVAKILKDRAIQIRHFIMMEKFFDEPIQFPVTMLFGENSDRNVYRSGELTDDYARRIYPRLRGIYEIKGGHGRFYTNMNIHSLSKQILSALNA